MTAIRDMERRLGGWGVRERTLDRQQGYRNRNKGGANGSVDAHSFLGLEIALPAVKTQHRDKQSPRSH